MDAVRPLSGRLFPSERRGGNMMKHERESKAADFDIDASREFAP